MRTTNLLPILLFALLISVPAAAIDWSRSVSYDIPEEILASKSGRAPVSLLTEAELEAIASYRYDADTLRVLVIPVEWDNRPATYGRETLDSLIFSRDVFPGGSVADYFHEVSYGQITVTGDVLDWYNAGIYLFQPRVFDYTARLEKSPRGEYELTDALSAMIQAGDRVAGLRIEGRWIDVRDPKVLADLEQEMT